MKDAHIRHSTYNPGNRLGTTNYYKCSQCERYGSAEHAIQELLASNLWVDSICFDLSCANTMLHYDVPLCCKNVRKSCSNIEWKTQKWPESWQTLINMECVTAFCVKKSQERKYQLNLATFSSSDSNKASLHTGHRQTIIHIYKIQFIHNFVLVGIHRLSRITQPAFQHCPQIVSTEFVCSYSQKAYFKIYTLINS